jgi:hypothetical protein
MGVKRFEVSFEQLSPQNITFLEVDIVGYARFSFLPHSMGERIKKVVVADNL